MSELYQEILGILTKNLAGRMDEDEIRETAKMIAAEAHRLPELVDRIEAAVKRLKNEPLKVVK